MGAAADRGRPVGAGEFGQEADILGKGYHVHGCRAALGHLLRQGGVAGLYARWLQFALRFRWAPPPGMHTWGGS